jgi:uncharacterized protein with FMN-binding domain
MKKVLLSAIVVGAFLWYSVYQRIFGAQMNPVIANKNNNQSSPTPSSSSTATPTPTSSLFSPFQPPTDTPIPQNSSSGFKDGTYTGDSADAFYGMIQVQATISQGRITNIQFLQYPNDRRESIEINQQADPMLAQEAIQAQNAQVDVISGATDSSNAFVESLQSALDKAKS